MANQDYDDNNYRNYSNNNDMHHLRRDAREAHTNSQLAKWLSIIALIASAIALGLSMYALNKAGEAQSTANQATESIQRVAQ